MEYLIPIVLVLLLVGGFVTFLVLNATKKSKPAEAEGSDDKAPTHMAATDESPLGDTTEHAGQQSDQGHTVRDPEGGGEDGGERGASVRPGEGEGGERVPQPESEKLANRRLV